MRRPELAWLTVFLRRYIPWVAIDLPLVWFCYAAALVLRGTTADVDYPPALIFAILASGIVVVGNELFGVYRRWWRYATHQDLVPLTMAVASATVAIVGADLYWPGRRPMPLGAIVLGGMFALVAMTAVRFRNRPIAVIQRTWRQLATPAHPSRARVLIVGAGEAGQLLGWQLQHAHGSGHHEVVGYVDVDRRKHGLLIHGRQVLGDRSTIPDLVDEHRVDMIVMTIHSLSGREFRDIVGICQDTSAQIKVLPNIIDSLTPGHDRGPQAGSSLFGDLTLEDLLGRHSVAIDREQCRDLVRGKTVLVSGASGSIGAELARQLADLRPGRLLLLDADESGVHDLSIELSGYRSDDTVLVPIVGDVTDERRMESIFAAERPAVVFHAAAYKHVPLMEEYPEEAVRVNVGGTRLLMSLALRYQVERFVLVSSDKAVEPSSVMGATKRICELVGGTMDRGATLFTAVRFGNVLASRGSVVPTFAKQIDLGGPVTITDPRMQRYFMSLSEAASLIIQAANYTRGGDVFILDMGEEINIADLARRMIRLRGLRPDVDIPVVVTGPRPGEKLREVLTSPSEAQVPTPHPQVFRVANGRPNTSAAELAAQVSNLVEAARRGDRAAVRQTLWAITTTGVAPVPISVGAPSGGGSGGVGPPPERVAYPASHSNGQAVPFASANGVERATAPADLHPSFGVLAERFHEAIARAADRVIATEPVYVLPACVALLTYPNSLIGFALAAVCLPWLLRWLRRGSPTISTPFDIAIGLFVLGATVGLLATNNDHWAGIRMTGIVAAVAIFYLVVNHVTSSRRLRTSWLVATGLTMVGSVALLALTAPYLGQGVGSQTLERVAAPADAFRSSLIGAEDALQRYRFRASGVGGLATFGMALAIGPALFGVRRSTRIVGYALAAFFGAVALFSGNRGSLVSIVALGVALLGLKNGWFLIAVPPVLVGLWLLVERGSFGVAGSDALPLTVKIQFWQNAAVMLHDVALTGAGLGLRSVREAYDAYFLPVGPPFTHAHNAFVQVYLEQGLLGCAGLAGLVTALLVHGRRAVASARDPLIAGIALAGGAAAMVLFFEGLTDVVLLTNVGFVLLMTALGLLVAAERFGRRIRAREHPVEIPSPAWRRALASMPVLPVFLIVFLGALIFTPLGSSLYLNLGAVERLRAQLQDGISIDERGRRLARSEQLLQQGIGVDDRDPAIWRNLAEIAIARESTAEARRLLGEARRRTSPSDGPGLYQLGRIYREAGLIQDAIASWRDALAGDELLAWGTDLRLRGQAEPALPVLTAAAELKQRVPGVFAEFAQAARAARGGPAGATVDVARLSRDIPMSPYPQLELARLYDELGRASDAAEARRQAQLRTTGETPQ